MGSSGSGMSAGESGTCDGSGMSAGEGGVCEGEEDHDNGTGEIFAMLEQLEARAILSNLEQLEARATLLT